MQNPLFGVFKRDPETGKTKWVGVYSDVMSNVDTDDAFTVYPNNGWDMVHKYPYETVVKWLEIEGKTRLLGELEKAMDSTTPSKATYIPKTKSKSEEIFRQLKNLIEKILP